MSTRVDHISIPGISPSISILRLDVPDPVSGGNKYFKLKYNLEEMRAKGQKQLLTFGGAYSNLIAAASLAGKQNGIETIGIIRGEELNERSNPVLKFASENGMRLHFVSRTEFRRRSDQAYCDALKKKFSVDAVFAEGLSNNLAVKGCTEILSTETDHADVIFCPVGTGATVAGIIASAKQHQEIIGIPALKDSSYLDSEVLHFLKPYKVSCKWSLDHSFGHELGGYGKLTDILKAFMYDIRKKTDLPLSLMYSGRTLYALNQRIKRGDFAGKKVLMIHTGGFVL